MKTTLCIDPGIRVAGAAVLSEGRLVACSVIHNPARGSSGPTACAAMARECYAWASNVIFQLYLRQPPGTGGALYPDEILTEWPQIYAGKIRAGKRGADPNDLLLLAGVDSAICALAPQSVCTHYLPATWKGQTPGDAMLARILGRLDSAERALVEAARMLAGEAVHNAIDAIGLGLFHMGRLERRRIIAR